MSDFPLRRLTEDDYLEIERLATYKSEFYDGVMYPMQPPPGAADMPGATLAHCLIKDNITYLLNSRIRGGPCLALSSDMRVKVNATGLTTYPDVVVLCDAPEFTDPDKPDTLLNPAVIVEVLSDATDEYDRGFKFENYQQIDTLREYVLVAQAEVKVERFVRQPDDTWAVTAFTDPGGSVPFTSVPADIPLAAIYRHVEFPESP